MTETNDNNEKKRSVTGFLTLANVRDLAVVALIIVVGVRFATADFNIDLKDFSFTDLVSLFLAVSSVALSALFYFKADESSRTFYTHTYKFTKEVSEMLGRIDSGFGEKLTNIGQGYSDLSQKFDRFSFDPVAAASRVENSEAKKAEIEEQEARRQDIIEELMQRASVAGEERDQLLERLSSLSRELEQSKAELAEQRRELDDEVDPGFKGYLGEFILKHFPKDTANGRPLFIRRRFQKVIDDPAFGKSAIRYMRRFGLMDEDELTDKGVELVRYILLS
ncbi:coiled-coil domain-containing protein [Pseudomonas sp. B19125]|uniref:coiled-coil domain-containing protein n=1 Tax=Pseudomonas sp. B19125 TaxID=3235109 RepID=UPI0037832820